MIGCRRFLTASAPRIVCLVPKFSHHTPAFIIYIVYQCPSATSATRPPSSRWYWPCLPKEVSKFQGEWSLQFKIYCQLRIKGPQNKVRDPWGQGLFALVGPSLWNTLPSAIRSIRSVQVFQAGSTDLLISFGICQVNQFANSDCDVLFLFSLNIRYV